MNVYVFSYNFISAKYAEEYNAEWSMNIQYITYCYLMYLCGYTCPIRYVYLNYVTFHYQWGYFWYSDKAGQLLKQIIKAY